MGLALKKKRERGPKAAASSPEPSKVSHSLLAPAGQRDSATRRRGARLSRSLPRRRAARAGVGARLRLRRSSALSQLALRFLLVLVSGLTVR